MTKKPCAYSNCRVSCRTEERVLSVAFDRQEQANPVTVPIPGAAESLSRSRPEMKYHHGRTAIRRY